MTLIPLRLQPRFRSVGWFEKRHGPVDSAIPRDHPAWEILCELGGLALPQLSPNINLIAFKAVSDAIASLNELETALNTKLFGIAELDDGHAELYAASRGQVIGYSLIHCACWLVGLTLESGLEAMARGERSRPILLPDETEVSLYGETFHQEDKDVVGPLSLTSLRRVWLTADDPRPLPTHHRP